MACGFADTIKVCLIKIEGLEATAYFVFYE